MNNEHNGVRRGWGLGNSLGHERKEKGVAKWPVAHQLSGLLPDFPGGVSPALKEQESKRLGHLGGAAPQEQPWESQGRTARLTRKHAEEGMPPSVQPWRVFIHRPTPSLGSKEG